jgi:hypothetical protein
MQIKQDLNGDKIISLLHELDNLLNEPCTIILCGGASAIVAHGLKRLTGDIDIFEPIPKTHGFYNHIKRIEQEHGLDPTWFNESAKGFSGCLNPGFKDRIIPVGSDFKNLSVYAISKADFITMKICAWREPDKDDITSVGVTNEDMIIIDENIAYLQKRRPDLADKALRVLSELGLKQADPLTPEKISNFAELIQFFKEQTGKDASVEEIKKWKERVSDGLRISNLARAIIKGKEISKGMDA